MLLRVAIAAATVATLAGVTPAFAQFYGDQGFGRQRFWEQRQGSPSNGAMIMPTNGVMATIAARPSPAAAARGR